jgi:hypothetical protein
VRAGRLISAGEKDAINLLPYRLGGTFGAVLPHLLDGVPALPAGLLHTPKKRVIIRNETQNGREGGGSTHVQVDLVRALGGRPLPRIPDDIEQQDDGEGEVRLEKCASNLAGAARGVAADGVERDVELRDEDEEDKDEGGPGAPDAAHGAKGQLFERVALRAPCGAEADVREADRAPREERGEPAKGEQPAEDERSARAQVDVREQAEDQDRDQGPERAPGLVDVGEYWRRVARLCEGHECTGAAVDA